MDSAKHHIPVYPIGVAEELAGLTGRQIRYYEKMGLLSPQRSPGNQRLYSEADIERLKEIKALLAKGLNIEGVRAALGTGPNGSQREPGGQPVPAAAEGPISAANDAYARFYRRAGKISLYSGRDPARLERLLRRKQLGPASDSTDSKGN
ncbi:MAG: MerR family transcriptional regulator [Syntrophothermus sp.]